MIRRDITLDDGRAGWALVSQVEHARIAAEMAAAWNEEVAALPVRHEEFLAAVLHHDDGWLAWELRPTVGDGRPRDFMEMPIDEAVAIWRRSIAVARNHGPLAGHAVSSHFAALCRWSRDDKRHDAHWLHLADEFLEEQTDLQNDWKQELAAQGMPTEQLEPQTARAWQGLRMFDLASLWLCCAERREPETVGIEGFVELRWLPDPSAESPATIRISPWPFRDDELRPAVRCRTIPAGEYPTDAALAEMLASAACRTGELSWRLLPG